MESEGAEEAPEASSVAESETLQSEEYEVEVASEGVEEESVQVESEGAEQTPEATSIAEGEALQPTESLSTDDSSLRQLHFVFSC